jgi:YidC/Oxa1 family membrane protein insertase
MKEIRKFSRMQEPKDKFKDDRDGLNRAVMELYKSSGLIRWRLSSHVVVQIPVFSVFTRP